jgi:hypothetical protein
LREDLRVSTYDPQEHRWTLERVIQGAPSIREDIKALSSFPYYDVDEPLAVLSMSSAREVLARHDQGQLSDADVEAWADALETRYDIELEPAHHDTLTELLFELSAPVMAGKPMAALADEWRGRLADESRG